MNNYELHMKTHTCHDECQNPVCVAVREAVAAEREANKDRIETLYQMYKMASQQRDELMQQQADALRARLAQPEERDRSAAKFIKPRPGWRGLTTQDKCEIINETEPNDRGYVMALVEAKLKGKNIG